MMHTYRIGKAPGREESGSRDDYCVNWPHNV